MKEELSALAKKLHGELHFDNLHRILYATDASVYRQLPLAVAYPKNSHDIQKLIDFAHKNRTHLIPRTAGTSLAGQVVGTGIVVDVSKHFTEIVQVNPDERWVQVQPGVVRDELNLFLKPYGLFFAPETATSNRAMIGGMIGNNSCGANSLVYGSTRDNLISVKGFLSDGTECEFKDLNVEEIKCKLQPLDHSIHSLEAGIYSHLYEVLSNPENQESIRLGFPKESIKRRNTGYAVDILLRSSPFSSNGPVFNIAKLIAGSEGTLFFITEATLRLEPLPPKERGLYCIHLTSVEKALRANLIVLKYHPSACELIDHNILECTKLNIEQQKNLFFVKGEPGAILLVEFTRETVHEIREACFQLRQELRNVGLGYHFPLFFGSDIQKIMGLRKAALGLLANVPGDAKPTELIEDAAIDVEDLPNYIAEFNEILQKYNLSAVHYGHVGSGELHPKPILNLKNAESRVLFRRVAEDVAHLVKKYRGSLSGEHGDGRVRGEFIPIIIGEKNYEILKKLKSVFDPDNIFNPGKIVNTPPMDSDFRFEDYSKTPSFQSVFHFRDTDGVLGAAEQCTGSGDCRKTVKIGGIMCPSYMVTRDEKDSTRGRANVLREMLLHSPKANRFDHSEILEAMDLCLSCKGCKSECPSSVDMARLKAEFLQHYYDANGTPLKTKIVGNFSKLMGVGAFVPSLTNFFLSQSLTKSIIGIAPKRQIPPLAPMTLRQWFHKHIKHRESPIEANFHSKLFLFCDEFTNYLDVEIGKRAVLLFEALGYEVIIPEIDESGRTEISKGLVRNAKKIATHNVRKISGRVSKDIPLVGIEPSTILSFRDEYLDLVDDADYEATLKLARNVYTFDEFIAREIDAGKINSSSFVKRPAKVAVHGHCHQKSLSSLELTRKAISLPSNYSVDFIPSGCCGMAGHFGYEKDHYEISMKIGELVLFPSIRSLPADTIVVASGTSCRAQIKDGTGIKALHPAELLWEATLP